MKSRCARRERGEGERRCGACCATPAPCLPPLADRLILRRRHEGQAVLRLGVVGLPHHALQQRRWHLDHVPATTDPTNHTGPKAWQRVGWSAWGEANRTPRPWHHHARACVRWVCMRRTFPYALTCVRGEHAGHGGVRVQCREGLTLPLRRTVAAAAPGPATATGQAPPMKQAEGCRWKPCWGAMGRQGGRLAVHRHHRARDAV